MPPESATPDIKTRESPDLYIDQLPFSKGMAGGEESDRAQSESDNIYEKVDSIDENSAAIYDDVPTVREVCEVQKLSHGIYDMSFSSVQALLN